MHHVSHDFNPNWINAFVRLFERCKISNTETIVVLTETATRPDLIALTDTAMTLLGHAPVRLHLPRPVDPGGPLIRSSGASQILTAHPLAIASCKAADIVIDLTAEGLMHAPETPEILAAKTRIQNISQEHPEVLARLAPDDAIHEATRAAVKLARAATTMSVTSPAGTDLTVTMTDAQTVGVWGWTDKPGTLAHWPGGLVVSFPKAGSVNGHLVFQPGDVNLSFKRYFDSEVQARVEDDHIVEIGGSGTDAALMYRYLADFGERAAYATSHVGWGLNPAARLEALSLYDKADTNGTEIRAVAGNFLYSTGANEFAGRFTRGHFDLPMMGCTIALDGTPVVIDGHLA